MLFGPAFSREGERFDCFFFTSSFVKYTRTGILDLRMFKDPLNVPLLNIASN